MEVLIYIIVCLVILIFSTWAIRRHQDIDGREFCLIIYISFVPIMNLIWLGSWIWDLIEPGLDRVVIKKKERK